MVDPNKKLSWESNKEFEYRKKSQKISQKLKEGLNLLQESAKKNLDFNKPKQIFEDTLIFLKNNVPKTYFVSNQKLITAVTCYINACDILKDAVETNNVKLTYKATNKINEGNLYMELSRLKCYQDIDKKVNQKG